MKNTRNTLALLSLLSIICIEHMHAMQHTGQEQTINTHNAGSSSEQVQPKEIVALSCELIALCNTFFNPVLMGISEKIRFTTFMHTLSQQHKRVGDFGIITKDCNLVALKNRLQAQLCTLKRLYLKLQLITIDTNENHYAFVVKKPNASELQNILFVAFEICFTIINDSFEHWGNNTNSDHEHTTIDNKTLAHATEVALQKAIALYLSIDDIEVESYFSFSSRKSCITNPLQNALEVDLFDDMPLFAEKALAFLSAYNNSYLNCQKSVAENNLILVEQLLDMLQTKHTITCDTSKAAVELFFTHKLLAMRKKLQFSKKLLEHAEQQPLIAAIFVKHSHLMESSNFAKLTAWAEYNNMSVVIHDYINLVETFLSNPTPSHLLTYHLDNAKAKIDGAINVINKVGTGWFELRLLKYIRLGGNLDTDSIQALEEMRAVFRLIQEQLPTFTSEKSQGLMSTISSIISGKWLSESKIKEISQKADGSVSLSFVDRLLGQKNFPDFKSAAMHVLMFASPFLLTKVIDYIKPYFSKNLTQQIENNTDVLNNGSPTKLLEFASKNPELMTHITKQSPEIIDLLSQSLRSLSTSDGNPK